MNTKTFKRYDVFLSYVVEDREAVEQLYALLKARGLRVFYAKRELYPGAELKKVIRRGLLDSRFGVALISPRYNSLWSLSELFLLSENNNHLIPILHEISFDELIAQHPMLVDCYCINTDKGMEYVADRIKERVGKRPAIYYHTAIGLNYFKRRRNVILVLLLLLSTTLLAFKYSRLYKPADEVINEAIKNRVAYFQKQVQEQLQVDLIQYNGRLKDLQTVKQLEMNLELMYPTPRQPDSVKMYFGSGQSSKWMPLKSPLRDSEPPFSMLDYRTYVFGGDAGLYGSRTHCAFYNIKPLHYKVVDSKIREGKYEVEIKYDQNRRLVEVFSQYDQRSGKRNRKYKFWQLPEEEVMVFVKRGKHWEVENSH